MTLKLVVLVGARIFDVAVYMVSCFGLHEVFAGALAFYTRLQLCLGHGNVLLP
jgi:hypothetical protein